MDAIDLLRQQIKESYDWLELVVGDITQEQANWRPSGTANCIGATYAHAMITADAGFNSQLQGGMPVIATDWKGQVGLSEMMPAGGGDFHWEDWARRVQVDWDILHSYGRAVRANVMGWLDSLTPADLERVVDMRTFGLGVWPGLEIYDLHGIKHIRMHGGEIACLKGLQGVRGYGWDRD